MMSAGTMDRVRVRIVNEFDGLATVQYVDSFGHDMIAPKSGKPITETLPRNEIQCEDGGACTIDGERAARLLKGITGGLNDKFKFKKEVDRFLDVAPDVLSSVRRPSNRSE